MNQEASIVFVTAPSRRVGSEIARKLVEKKLVACVNILGPIQSIYTWQGEIQEDEEVLLVIKTWDHLFESHLIPAIKEMHPYEVPEILGIPVMKGLPEYLAWMSEVTQE